MFIPLLAMALFGPDLAPYARHYTEPVHYEEGPEGTVLKAPPSPPSTQHWLGTDRGGRDLFSSLLYGARWTLGFTLIIAALKVLLGGFIGLFRVFHRQHKSRINPLSALPLVVFLYFLLARISLNFPFDEMILVSIFGVVVLIFGVPANAAVIEAAGRELKSREFFEAAHVSGAGKFHLIIHHMLPFLKDRLLTLFISEIISVLNIIGQMGIFGVFLGATVKTFDPPILNSRLHEWAGLVGQARFYIYNYQWILLGPLAVYLFYLLSLYFLLEGIKEYFRKTYRLY